MTAQDVQLQEYVTGLGARLPTEMKTTFLALSEEAVLREELVLTTDLAELAHGLWNMARQRCRVCEPKRSCAHCIAETERFMAIQKRMFVFAALLTARAAAKTPDTSK